MLVRVSMRGVILNGVDLIANLVIERMKFEDTAGNVTYTIPNCACGLTGGCEYCQPIHISRYGCRDYIFLETHEERFLGPQLKEFYRKKGLLYKDES